VATRRAASYPPNERSAGRRRSRPATRARLVGAIAAVALDGTSSDTAPAAASAGTTADTASTASSIATTASGELSAETIYRRDAPGVVVITSTETQRVPATFFTPATTERLTSLGSGFVIDKKGDIVTNDHVIQGGHGIRVGFRARRVQKSVRGVMPPVRAPNANVYAERWVRTVRADCLDHLLIVGRRHLERVLRVYARHYNAHRPHRALGLAPPDRSTPVELVESPVRATRRDLLGGLIHEYQAAA
jgi:hypothetical protein